MTTQPTTDLEMALVDVLNGLRGAREIAGNGTTEFMSGATHAYDDAIDRIERLIGQRSGREAQREQDEEDARTNEMEMWGPQGRPAMPRGGW